MYKQNTNKNIQTHLNIIDKHIDNLKTKKADKLLKIKT